MGGVQSSVYMLYMQDEFRVLTRQNWNVIKQLINSYGKV